MIEQDQNLYLDISLVKHYIGGMNNKEIINMYPKWVWAGNIFCLTMGLAVIIFV